VARDPAMAASFGSTSPGPRRVAVWGVVFLPAARWSRVSGQRSRVVWASSCWGGDLERQGKQGCAALRL
jgi:hypothetical protein